MKKLILCFSLIVTCFIKTFGQSQAINVNPDPNGEPWRVGCNCVYTPEEHEALKNIPFLSLTPESVLKPLPPIVDNSLNKYFRGIFRQDDSCCSQAAGVAYTFAYEINRLRELDGSSDENKYPTHFTWNFLNLGV